MKRLGLRATVQDHPVKLGHNMIRYWGEERAARSIPVRTILAAGIPTGGGTDAPVVDWNPFESIWWMVTRKIYAQGEHARARRRGGDRPRGSAASSIRCGSAETCFMEDKGGLARAGQARRPRGAERRSARPCQTMRCGTSAPSSPWSAAASCIATALRRSAVPRLRMAAITGR